jgi:hypothetical protein
MVSRIILAVVLCLPDIRQYRTTTSASIKCPTFERSRPCRV